MNAVFAVEVILTFGVLLFSGRMLYLSIYHDAFFRKHKPGTFQYRRARQLMSAKARTMAAIATPLVIIATILTGNHIAQRQGKSGIEEMESILLFLVLIIVGVIVAACNIFKNEE